METNLAVVFLLILGFFLADPVKRFFKELWNFAPASVFMVPMLLAGNACAAALYYNPITLTLVNSVYAYAVLPTFLIYAKKKWFTLRGVEGFGAGISWLDLAVVMMLWLPIEWAMYAGAYRPYFQSSGHILAYGSAVVLALCFFAAFHNIGGMKYNLPRRLTDFIYPLLGFVIAAPILIYLGLRLGFIGSFSVPHDLKLSAFVLRFAGIFAGVALPEEILFRSLIQNILMQKLGSSNKTLLLAALIFGASHLNNGPGPLPNWRYMILATIAGFIYGKVFQKSSSVFASAGLHALVNTVRHTFFR